jgi:3-isopropylmalate/(R)-2-methylmalate dehydratase small subunit
MNILKGKVHKFGDSINTDNIISSKAKTKTVDVVEMSSHLMEDTDPTFYSRIQKGDFIVAGSNFGCGSSREAAPAVIRTAGIGAVLAKSFARIFFRNGINIGLPLLECNTDLIENGDLLSIDLEKNIVENSTSGKSISINPLPPVMVAILAEGGLEGYFQKNKKFHIP